MITVVRSFSRLPLAIIVRMEQMHQVGVNASYCPGLQAAHCHG